MCVILNIITEDKFVNVCLSGKFLQTWRNLSKSVITTALEI